MWNVSLQIDRRRGNALLGVAILFGVTSFFISRSSYELCHSGLPLALLGIVVPTLGASCAFVALFFSSSSTSVNLARFAHWTLRDKAAQRRLALR